MMLTVKLPWPSADLSPNGRLHWAAKASAVRKARADAYLLTMQGLRTNPALHEHTGPLALTLRFFPPTKARFDTDGLLTRCKAGIDGIADALKVNDQQFNPIALHREAPCKPGWVLVEIVSQESA